MSKARILAAVVVSSVMAATLPQLVRELRRAVTLRPLSLRERRIRIFGDFYVAVSQLERELRRDEPVAVVIGPQAPPGDDQVLSTYLYPIRTVRYRGLRTYANASNGKVPRPSTIIYVGSPVPRRMTYGEIRAEESRGICVVCSPHAAGEPMRRFILPIASSIDGGVKDSYVIEGAVVAERDATLTMTFFPNGTSRDLRLRAGVPIIFRDLVWDDFHTMDVGWIVGDATDLVRASFWFVNRGARRAASLPLLTSIPGGRARLYGDGRLWLLNGAPSEQSVRVNGSERILPPHALLSSPVLAATNVVECPPLVYGFVTQKEGDGQTRFIWPEWQR